MQFTGRCTGRVEVGIVYRILGCPGESLSKQLAKGGVGGFEVMCGGVEVLQNGELVSQSCWRRLPCDRASSSYGG